MDAKEAFYSDKDVFAAEDIDTYAELWCKLYSLRAYMALKDGSSAPQIPNENDLSEEVKTLIKPQGDAKA